MSFDAAHFRYSAFGEVNAGSLILVRENSGAHFGIVGRIANLQNDRNAVLILNDSSNIRFSNYDPDFFVAIFSDPWKIRLSANPKDYANSYQGGYSAGDVISTNSETAIASRFDLGRPAKLNLSDYSVTPHRGGEVAMCSKWDLVCQPNEMSEIVLFSYHSNPKVLK